MSASDKLSMLNDGHTMSGLKVVPIYRKTGPKGGGDESYTRARDVESVMDALPKLLAVVEAAESVTSADQGAWHGSRLLLSLTALEEALS